ncbi:MAG: KamA family radical SAM protein [Desulfobacteraceae bacterium]|nr:MAG: KamA family radical SAM protein [Desulfobacteraceae bacterium]
MKNWWEKRDPSGWIDLAGESIVRPQDLPARLSADTLRRDAVAAVFPMKVNPYVLSLIQSAEDPIGLQFIPHPAELEDTGRSSDPLAEERQSPAPQVIHRYPHRVVLLVSNQCAVHCRFCMRKRRMADPGQVSHALIERGIAYIRGNASITEVILSGGDPLMLGDDQLLSILQDLRGIPQVRLLRMHTRVPAVCPRRITESLARRMSAFHPLYINIHFNHPLELTPAAMTACHRLADAGIPLGSQTVLLKGINDDARVLCQLMEKLLFNRIRPYYIHQVDRVPGTAHFQVPIQKSLQLMNGLRGKLSGLAMPHLMIDLPGGGGKVALTPEVVVARQKDHWLVRNWEGKIYTYPCG